MIANTSPVVVLGALNYITRFRNQDNCSSFNFKYCDTV